MDTKHNDKPTISLVISYIVGALQLVFFIPSLFYDGPGDQNLMMIWYAMLFIPSLIIIIIVSSNIQTAVNNNTVSRKEGYPGLYMFSLPLIMIFILLPIWEIIKNITRTL